jgi:signal transduction histidine kinase
MEKQRQVLTLDLPDQLPLIVSDRATLRRLLLELIQNAHKHTPEGGEISLTVRHDPRTSHITFTVQNQAEIPAAELPHIFEKFYRAQKAGSWDVSGTGLGLALVKELVKQLQGDIQVASESGWTTFIVHLPDRLAQQGF